MFSQPNNIQWSFLTELISMGKCTPLLSNSVILDYVFDGQNVNMLWADHIEYPMPDKDNLAHVSQYLSVINGDEFLAKVNYLTFLKRLLLAQARENTIAQMDATYLATLNEEIGRLTVSQVIKRLGFHNFSDKSNNALSILASLPFPVYLTTSYHCLLEDVLTAVGKTPHTDYYRWSEELEESHFVDATAAIKPSVEQPLVYHLFGVDSNPGSLVLTEENHFEFFEHIAHDLERSQGVPDAVRHALAASSLFMLGYDLQSWAFRVLFRGPIKAIFNQRRPLSLSIQFEPQPEAGVTNTDSVRRYLNDYFRGYKFNIFWGDVSSFMQQLQSHWDGSY